MSSLPVTDCNRLAVAALFERGPVLVEVAFHRCGTSSDWYLLEDYEAFARLTDSLPTGREVLLTSVWDIPVSVPTLRWKVGPSCPAEL